MTSALRAGVLGVGNIGTVHLQSLRAMAGVTVPAVADAVEANRARARRLGVARTYDDYERLLAEEDLDLVVVALPPSLHGPATTAATERGCHTFVEKPLAHSLEVAREMVAAAERAGVRLGVDHTLRYLPEVERVKAAYDDGAIGHVPFAFASRVNDGPFQAPPPSRTVPTWQLSPEHTGGGVLMDLGVHLFDYLSHLFGPLELAHVELGAQLELPYEDSATVVLRAASGTLATLHCGYYQWEHPPDLNHYLRLEGVAGTLESTDHAPGSYLQHAARGAAGNVLRRARGRPPDVFEPTYWYRAHYRALEAFVEALRRDDPVPVSGADGVRTLELVDAAYRAADRPPLEPTAPVGEAR